MGYVTTTRPPLRQEWFDNFQFREEFPWALDESPVRRVLDRVLVDVVLDPRLGTPPSSVLLVSLAGSGTARLLLGRVPAVTVFDPSGLGFQTMPASRAADRGIVWAQGASLKGLPEQGYDTIVVDHIGMMLLPEEVPDLLAAACRRLVPGGLLVLLHGHTPLPGWAYGAKALHDDVSGLIGAPSLELDLGQRLLGAWRP